MGSCISDQSLVHFEIQAPELEGKKKRIVVDVPHNMSKDQFHQEVCKELRRDGSYPNAGSQFFKKFNGPKP